MRSIREFTVIGVFALATSLIANRSWAGAQEQAAAEALFQDARQLMKDGKFADACPKLSDSNKLDPAVGTLLYLGECYEKNGQTASAWVTFQTAAETAQKAGQPDRAHVASDRATALWARLSKITINVAAAARVPGLEIKRDGVDVGQATWGVGVPVDPGEHAILARAPGKQDWSQTVRVDPDGKVAVVEIPMLANAAMAPPPPVMQQPQQQQLPPKLDQGTSTSNGNSQRVVGFVAGGVGVVGLVAGTVFGLQAKNKQDQSASHCLPTDPTKCDQTGVDLRHQGHSAATMSNVGFAVGAVGIVGGAILYLTAPSNSKPKTASVDVKRPIQYLNVVPVVGAQSSSLLITGSF
jgi:serine/threonine-protein kinase